LGEGHVDQSRFHARLSVGLPMFQETPSGGELALKELEHLTATRDPAGKSAARVPVEVPETEKRRAIGQLAGGIAHELNNLLQVIEGYADLMTMDPSLSRESRTDLDQITSASRRAAALTRQLLTIGNRQFRRVEATELNELAKLAVEASETMPGRITLRCANLLLPIRADRGQLVQAIQAVIANALEADDENPILVDVSRNGDRGCVVVRDHGKGMTASVLARASEPFFTTKDVGKGPGLGLAVASSVVEQHEGAVTLDSVPLEGTTVSILIPLLT
jgi:signal transduction histidine kinase